MVNNSSKNNLSKKKNQSLLRSSPIINRNYLPEQTIKKIRYSFRYNKDFPSISLINFLDKNSYFFLRKELSCLNLIKQKNPLLHSYSKSLLPKHVTSFFNRKDLHDFITKIIGIDVDKIDLSYYRFSRKDYMMLHDPTSNRKKNQRGYDLLFDLTLNWNEEWGGTIFCIDCFGNHHKILQHQNTLTIIERKRENNSYPKCYLKYINNYAKNNKRLLIMGKIITSK